MEQSDVQNEFLRSLKDKIDKKNGVKLSLWKYSYSFMRIVVIITGIEKINKHEILKVVSEELKTETFENLVRKFNFKNGFVIKNKLYENKLIYKFERNRDRNRPHGKFNCFGSDPYYDYGHDKAGSSWRRIRYMPDSKYELLEWAED